MDASLSQKTLGEVPFRIQIDRAMPQLQRKQTGSYYTADHLSAIMVEELIASLTSEQRENLYELRFLEPCVGVGSFVFAYLASAAKMRFLQTQYRQLLENIYVCDTNESALKVYSDTLRSLAFSEWGIELDDEYFKAHIGGGLLFDLSADTCRYMSINDIFGKNSENSFDIVITNPPYKNLKAERTHYPNDAVYNRDKERYSAVGIYAKKLMRYSTVGVINLYKLFVEEITERYAKNNGIVSLLIPSSILTDKTCSKLRRRIFDTAGIKSIKVISESSDVVDANQALCALLFLKGKQFKTISICPDYASADSHSIEVETVKAIDKESDYSILILNYTDYRTLRKLRTFPKIKDLPYIVNLRGELDLTANNNAISSEQGEYPLIRGRNIGYYQLVDFPSRELVLPQFVAESSKRGYIHIERIICQQIANMAKERRLTFALVPHDVVLGNSCNFISVGVNDRGIDTKFMLGLLNSSIMNWYFKIQSSNNHINNYEIDLFPVPVDYTQKDEISRMVSEILQNPSRTDLVEKIDGLVNEAFGLSDKPMAVNNNEKLRSALQTDLSNIIPGLSEMELTEIATTGWVSDAVFFKHLSGSTSFDKKVVRGIADKYMRLSRGEVLNHTTFKLSELDLEMVRAVPQGGSWKDIPPDTVAKSKRLERITQTGGRTTLYGRIAYDKPSYTITTYFSRPGNGTYIHSIYDRVISVREAARFQAFPDSYYFLGNKAQLLNQVGNAVPPLFAYQIATSIMKSVSILRSVDLFCGAGGMTVGFKQAGIKSVLSTDIEPSACLTLKLNNPEINVLCGDVTKQEVKERIIETAKAESVDIICGGPPCQGFSMAGFRLTDDPRNQLFKDFIDIVSEVYPKMVVFENVEGLLTFQRGETYNLIHRMFGCIGYETEGRLLKTQMYGIPQKRKRVIIICVRKDVGVLPESLYPKIITPNYETQITARMAISDLEKVECGETAMYDSSDCSDYIRMLKAEISPEEYIGYLKKAESTATRQDDAYQMSLFELA